MICLTQRFTLPVDPDPAPEFLARRFCPIRIMAVSGTKYTKKFNRHYKETLDNYLSIASLCFSPLFFQALLMDPDPAIFTNAKFSRN
jgi:hypothetical protein